MTVSSPRPLNLRPLNQAARRSPRTPATRISYRAGPPEVLTAAPASAAPPGLAEPLTDRELEVLQLLAAGKSNQRIAHDLVVALDTVKLT